MARPSNSDIKTVAIIVLGCLTAISWGYGFGSKNTDALCEAQAKADARIQAVEVKQQAKDVYDATFQAEVRLTLQQIQSDIAEIKTGLRQ